MVGNSKQTEVVENGIVLHVTHMKRGSALIVWLQLTS